MILTLATAFDDSTAAVLSKVMTGRDATVMQPAYTFREGRRAMESSAAGCLDRMLDPLAKAMPPDFARALLSLKADPQTEARIEVLRRKANEGAISADDDAEYKSLVEAIDFVSVLQSKAQQSLMY